MALLQIEFDDIGAPIGDHYAGSYSGLAEFDEDGTVTDFDLNISEWDVSAKDWRRFQVRFRRPSSYGLPIVTADDRFVEIFARGIEEQLADSIQEIICDRRHERRFEGREFIPAE